jgi:Ca-activated chloride channel family protein
MINKQENPKRGLLLLCMVGCYVIAILGCGGGGGGSSSGSNPGTPSIATQGVLDFGTAVIPNSSSRVLTISNSGSASLAIGQIALLQAGTPFEVALDGCSNTSLAPSGSCQVTVQLTTNASSVQTDYTNTLSIPSNDPASPLALPVAGQIRKWFVSINEISLANCPKLQLLVSVVDGSGASVPGLDESYFTLYENGLEKFISSFQEQAASDLSVALLLDNSTSIVDLDVIQDAAKAFIDQLKPNDEAAVLKFAKTTTPTTGLTFITDKDALKALVDAPFTGDTDGTILYDVVYDAVDALNAQGPNRRRAVVVLSDGLDVGSSITLQGAINQALSVGIPVYAIAITDAVDPRPEIMKQLADGTYGAYFEAADASAVGGIYSQVAGILSDQYLIEYNSASSGGATIDLNVKVEDTAGDKGDALRDGIIGCQ